MVLCKGLLIDLVVFFFQDKASKTFEVTTSQWLKCLAPNDGFVLGGLIWALGSLKTSPGKPSRRVTALFLLTKSGVTHGFWHMLVLMILCSRWSFNAQRTAPWNFEEQTSKPPARFGTKAVSSCWNSESWSWVGVRPERSSRLLKTLSWWCIQASRWFASFRLKKKKLWKVVPAAQIVWSKSRMDSFWWFVTTKSPRVSASQKS